MNFLAHLHLSGKDEGLLVGNFIADHIKGTGYLKFPVAIQKGILMHRAIDSFTDNHPVFKSSTERIRKSFGKYAPVVTDIYYDHILALNWHDYHESTLLEFANSTYCSLNKNHEYLPEKSKHFLFYLQHYNMLYNYSKIEGLEKVFNGMSARAKFDSGMEKAAGELSFHFENISEDFKEFYSDVLAMCNKFKDSSFL